MKTYNGQTVEVSEEKLYTGAPTMATSTQHSFVEKLVQVAFNAWFKLLHKSNTYCSPASSPWTIC
jgi:hypothetical protein